MNRPTGVNTQSLMSCPISLGCSHTYIPEAIYPCFQSSFHGEVSLRYSAASHTTSRARRVDRLYLLHRSLACICRTRSVANCTPGGFDRRCVVYVPESRALTCPDIYALITCVMPLCCILWSRPGKISGVRDLRCAIHAIFSFQRHPIAKNRTAFA
ncbi:hypothetical protein F5J12DRAFT_476817 [Pisolithus orientalis]|uniref:uncharacterized protein n=1 Tax=Pisolithus orientalis TaxID=936130 RepID=UPI0022249E16|nr:uncharacterized protein F5J12DRAFT_476817 [Pisolithus orientalis]KAI5990297.1 hypothetical protein F5J12DRAFT_476817 [Pisolithus orientalis]